MRKNEISNCSPVVDSHFTWSTSNPPKILSRYLITTELGTLNIAEWSNKYWTGKNYFEGEWRWICSYPHCKVVAWMPLPKIYEREEKKNV